MKKLIMILFLMMKIGVFAELVKAPDFELVDLQKQGQKSETYNGKVRMYVFWESWCDYSREFLPILEELYKEKGKNKEDLIILTFNKEDKDILSNFLKEQEYSFPIINDEVIFEKYYIEKFPSIVLVDKQGAINQYIVGAVDKVKLLELVEKIN